MLHICVCRQSWSKWFYCTWASDTNNPLIACDASGENVINVEQVSCLKKNWVHSTPVISRHYSLLGEMCSVKAVLLLKLDPQCAQCVEIIVWQQMNEDNISHLTEEGSFLETLPQTLVLGFFFETLEKNFICVWLWEKVSLHYGRNVYFQSCLYAQTCSTICTMWGKSFTKRIAKLYEIWVFLHCVFSQQLQPQTY